MRVTDYCVGCGDATPDDDDDGRYVEFEPVDNHISQLPDIRVTTEQFVCEACLNGGAT